MNILVSNLGINITIFMPKYLLGNRRFKLSLTSFEITKKQSRSLEHYKNVKLLKSSRNLHKRYFGKPKEAVYEFFPQTSYYFINTSFSRNS